jgi:translation elongation factor EF-4
MNTKESFIKSNTNEKPMKRVLTNPLKKLDPSADVEYGALSPMPVMDTSYGNFQSLAAAINDFDDKLAENQITLIATNNLTIAIERVTWLAPSFVRLGGISNGSYIELVQSVSNVNLVMVAHPKSVKEPQRQPIGFYTESTEPIDS